MVSDMYVHMWSDDIRAIRNIPQSPDQLGLSWLTKSGQREQDNTQVMFPILKNFRSSIVIPV